MSDSDKNKELLTGESCDCNGPGCCQPKPRKNWQKFVFLAVILFAAGIIAFKLFCASPNDPACKAKGCCADTTQCSGNTKCADSAKKQNLK